MVVLGFRIIPSYALLGGVFITRGLLVFMISKPEDLRVANLHDGQKTAVLTMMLFLILGVVVILQLPI